MRRNWKMVVGCFLVLAMLAVPLVGCGGGGGGGVTITLGEIDDFTGSSGAYMSILSYGFQDVVRYYNEQGLIPGAKIKLVTYDTQLDPSRDIPGYEWVKERGAKVIVIGIISPGEDLKPFSEQDKIPLCDAGTTLAMFNPPGWSFGFNPPIRWSAMTMLQWESENWDYSQGVPKVGLVDWIGSYATDLENAMKDYCQSHPDQFQWGGSYLEPSGTVTWSGVVEKLKDCQIIDPGQISVEIGTFLTQFWAKGYKAQLIGEGSVAATEGFLVDSLGWNNLDGFLSAEDVPWWNEDVPIINTINEILHKYRPGQAANIIKQGSTYKGGAYNMFAILDIVRLAVEEVGAKNFDGQAFYNAAVKYKTTLEGLSEWSFSETKRVISPYDLIYRWSAQAQDLVKVSDWIPCVTE
jgi:ABC-type branched-subunit amino acid transport system substrate-binding protein